MSNPPSATRGRAILACGMMLAAAGTWAFRLQQLQSRTTQDVDLPAAALRAPCYPPEHALYIASVKPLLRSQCVSCHGLERHQGGLRLDSASGIFKGGRHGAIVVRGEPDRSPLFQRVTAAVGPRMPKEGPPLRPEEIQLLRR